MRPRPRHSLGCLTIAKVFAIRLPGCFAPRFGLQLLSCSGKQRPLPTCRRRQRWTHRRSRRASRMLCSAFTRSANRRVPSLLRRSADQRGGEAVGILIGDREGSTASRSAHATSDPRPTRGWACLTVGATFCAALMIPIHRLIFVSGSNDADRLAELLRRHAFAAWHQRADGCLRPSAGLSW